MDTSITCVNCTLHNEALASTCAACDAALPSDREKLRVLLGRIQTWAAHAKALEAEVADLRSRLEPEEVEPVRQPKKTRAEVEAKTRELQVAGLASVLTIDTDEFRSPTWLSRSSTYDTHRGFVGGTPVVEKRLAACCQDSDHAMQFTLSTALLSSLSDVCSSILPVVGIANLQTPTMRVYTPYMARGDLAAFLDETPRATLPWPTRLTIARDVAQALAAMHARDLVHRDVQAAHVLLDDAHRAKVTGLSSARTVAFQMTAGVGNFRYAAPETLLEGVRYSEKADVYALGLILIELSTHDRPYAHMVDARGQPCSDMRLLDALRSATPGCHVTAHRVGDGCPTWYRDLALQCVGLKSEDRPSAADVVESLTHHQLRVWAFAEHRSTPTAHPARPPLRTSQSMYTMPSRPMSEPMPQLIPMVLTVIRAKNLVDTQVFGTQDPFVKISCGRQCAQTKIHDNGGHDPEWREQFVFKHINPMDMIVEMSIRNSNWVVDGQIGKASVVLEDWLALVDARGRVRKWVEVFSGGVCQGHILVSIQFECDLVAWLKAYNDALEGEPVTPGRVADKTPYQIQQDKITNILLPRLRRLVRTAANIAQQASFA